MRGSRSRRPTAVLLVYNRIGSCELLTTAKAEALVAVIGDGKGHTGSPLLLPTVRASDRHVLGYAASGTSMGCWHHRPKNRDEKNKTKSRFHIPFL